MWYSSMVADGFSERYLKAKFHHSNCKGHFFTNHFGDETKKEYFTSCDPHRDISRCILGQIISIYYSDNLSDIYYFDILSGIVFWHPI